MTEVQTQLVQGRGKLGATAINGCVRAARECVDGLRGLGLLPPVGGHSEHDKPQDLIVRVLSPSEEDEIRAALAAQAGEELSEDISPPPAPSSPTLPHRPVALIDRLPEAKDFEGWIAAMLHMRGAAWLRQIVGGLGGQTAHGKDQLASELMRLTCGDPQRLRHLVGEPA